MLGSGSWTQGYGQTSRVRVGYLGLPLQNSGSDLS
jgi:hypothetical protein